MIDLHLHTVYSDGKDDVESLVKNLKSKGIKYFSITDHDTAESARQIFANKDWQKLISENDMVYVPGIEYTCTYKGQKMHILAYDFDPNAPEVFEIENGFKGLLAQKAHEKIQVLADMGYKLSDASMEELKTKINIRTLDIANCLVNDGHIADVQEAARLVSKGLKVPTVARLDAELVIKKMTSIGAKLVWAHSLYGIGDKPRTHEQVEELAKVLKEFGLVGLECYYSLYNKDEIAGLLEIRDRLGLFSTLGSDYHGANKTVQIGEFSVDNTPVNYDDIDVNNIFINYVIK